MKKRTERKIVVVTRETRIDGLKKRFTSVDQLSFYVERRGGNVEDYLQEDKIYKQSLGGLKKRLSSWGTVQFVDRAFLPNYVFGPEDTVIAIGQDGLVANTLKYLVDRQPLIGVNPDPNRWDGVLLSFRVEDLEGILPDVLEGSYHSKVVSMASAKLNDGQEILAVNDFFIGQRSHASARYFIESGGIKERHSSSGVIVSTGLGSTGWLKSILHGASSISSESGGSVRVSSEFVLPWDTSEFYFSVREPFPSKNTDCNLVFGSVTSEKPLRIRSLMSENGVLFSDGVESDFLEFNSGAEVEISISSITGNVVVR